MMRVLVAFSLTNGKTQPYKSTSPPVKMRTGPCARLPRDLGSALSEPARLSLASNIGLRLGMVRLTREDTRLDCLPRSASSSRRQQPHQQWQLRLRWAMAARCPGGFDQILLVTELFPFLYPEATVVPTYTTCRGYHLAYPCPSHQHREALRCGIEHVGCVVSHYQTGGLDCPTNPHHISDLPSPARQGADDCCPPPEPPSTHMRMTAGPESSSPISR